MIALVPEWAREYDEFWDSIKKRNIWFIRLRYGAVATLLAFAFVIKIFFEYNISDQQFVGLVIIAFSILTYNVIIHIIRKHIKTIPLKFNNLHLSLVQIIGDLIALFVVVYFTGGIESPLYLLFIFHMIIGSMILPGRVIYTMAGLIVFFFSLFAYLEYSGVLKHHPLVDYLDTPLYTNEAFIFITCVVLGFVLFTSVYLANGIAKQLYQSERNLWESIAKLKTAEEQKQKYILAVVHEIKRPLTAVNSYLNIVLGRVLGDFNEQIEERLQRSLNRSNEAVDLINDVLKISNLRLLDHIYPEEIHIHELIEQVIDKYKSTIESKSLDFEFIDNRLAQKIFQADKFLMELVFSNLISNAVKYVDEGGKVKVIIEDHTLGATVRVVDNGIGIPKADQGNIFSDFFRASNIKGKGIEGTGLGLSLVKQIVEKHNGTIQLVSPSELQQDGKPGTEIRVMIPV